MRNMSFSAHADSKGIMNLIKHCEPESVVLVHGEKGRMEVFAEVVRDSLKIPCYYPANFEDLFISVKSKEQPYPVQVQRSLLQSDESASKVEGAFLFVKRVESIHAPPKLSLERELITKLKKADFQPNSRMVDETMEEEQEVKIIPHVVARYSMKDFK